MVNFCYTSWIIYEILFEVRHSECSLCKVSNAHSSWGWKKWFSHWIYSYFLSHQLLLWTKVNLYNVSVLQPHPSLTQNTIKQRALCLFSTTNFVIQFICNKFQVIEIVRIFSCTYMRVYATGTTSLWYQVLS